MSDEVMINWTPEMLERFRVAHKKARDSQGKDGVFVFEGHEFLVSYSGYLIEFLDSRFHPSE